MRTCLETYSMDERVVEINRNDYYRNKNEYHNSYIDGLGPNKDLSEKSTGHAGHSHWLPNCSGQIGVFNYSNFDTSINSGAGNIADNKAREEALTRSLYSPTYRYSFEASIDTSMNVLDGQYVNKY